LRRGRLARGSQECDAENYNGTPNEPRVVLTIGYDHAGRRTSLGASVASTADFLNNYTYDSLDRLTRVTQAQQTGGNSVAAKRVDFAYNSVGQFTSINRYADTTGTNLVATSSYGYNGDGAMTSLSHTKGATTLNSFTWGYDNDGRLTSVSSNDGSDAYTYDAASQVTAVTHSYQANEKNNPTEALRRVSRVGS
jgi:YD repeat-containing protein